MFLIVALGNPGLKYAKTRHNAGQLIMDLLPMFKDTTFETKEKFKTQIARVMINNHQVILSKPLTYMNLSGYVVRNLAMFYKICSQKIIVIHDDIDLDFGTVKTKIGGGSAGHNGIKSIDKILGTNKYYRIRFGIGRPLNSYVEISSFVLQDFTDSEQIDLRDKINVIESKLESLIA